MSRVGTRTERRDPGRARVTARDALILRLVARYQPLHVGLVVTALGMTLAMARRRLSILKDLGCIRVFVEAQERPNRYLLTREGAAVLGRVEGRSVEEYRLPKALPRAPLAHHDAAAGLAVALEVACAKTGRFVVEEVLLEAEIRRRVGEVRKGALLPDGIVAGTLDGTRRFALVIEADENTENPSFFARKAALGYAAIAASGGTILGARDFRVLVTVPSRRRANRLSVASWDAGVSEGLVLFGVKQELRPEVVLRDVWVTPRLVAGEAVLVPSSPLQGVLTGGDLRDHGFEPLASASELAFPPGATGRFWRGDAP